MKKTILRIGVLVMLASMVFAGIASANNLLIEGDKLRYEKNGVWYTITPPSATGTLTTSGGTETLTNKTLTTPTITGGTATSTSLVNATLSGASTTAKALIINSSTTALSFEGATENAYETTFSITEPTADRTFTIPNASGAAIISNLTTNAPDIANSVMGGTNALIFEGSSADAYECSIQATNPTADVVFTLPNATGTAMVSSLSTNAPDAANSVWGASNALVFEGATANANETSFTPTDPTADRTITFPDASGSVPLVLSQTSATVTQSGTGVANIVSITVGTNVLAGDTWEIYAIGNIGGANAAKTFHIDIGGTDRLNLATDGADAGDFELFCTYHVAGVTNDHDLSCRAIMAAAAEIEFDYVNNTSDDFTAGATLNIQAEIANAGDGIAIRRSSVRYFRK